MRRFHDKFPVLAVAGVLATPAAPSTPERVLCPDVTDSRIYPIEDGKGSDGEGLVITRTLEWAKARMCDERLPLGVTISQTKVCYDLNTGQRIEGSQDRLTIVGPDGKAESYPELTPQQVFDIGAQYQQACRALDVFAWWVGPRSECATCQGDPRSQG